MSIVTPSDAQWAAIRMIVAWYRLPKDQRAPFFYLGGFAGTGKTAIAKFIIKELGLADHEVLGACYTAKASLNLARAGFPKTQTCHSLIYKNLPKGKGRVPELREQLDKLLADEDSPRELIARLEKQIRDELNGLRVLSWDLNIESDLKNAKLAVVDECFPKGTKIDTPSGHKLIDQLVPGDIILNACGNDVVKAICRKEVINVCKIKCGEKTIYVSENHPFFTTRGVISASDIRPGDRLTWRQEALRLLQDRDNNLCLETTVLHGTLLNALVATVPGVQKKGLYRKACEERGGRSKTVFKFRFERSRETGGKNSKIEPDSRQESLQKNKHNIKIQESFSLYTWRKWKRLIYSTTKIIGTFTNALGCRISSNYRFALSGLSSLLQIGSSGPKQENFYRGGWWFSSFKQSKTSRPKEDRIPKPAWVDSVEVLEQGHPELDSFRDASGKLYFYDIEATRHSSFSVEGILVHNCSMIGEVMGKDMLTFGTPILVLGDPGQLPPVGDAAFFTKGQPNFFLTEVHRQAQDSAIIRLATMMRENGYIRPGVYEDPSGHNSHVVQGNADPQKLLSASQIIVGRNKTRHSMNHWYRTQIDKIGRLPFKGDKLVCLKNKAEYGLINGGLYESLADAKVIDKNYCLLTVQSLDFPDQDEQTVKAHSCLFYGDPKEVDPWAWAEAQGFDYSYALTCHKAQGSQFPHTAVKVEWPQAETFKLWAYTALTRAQLSTYVVID